MKIKFLLSICFLFLAISSANSQTINWLDDYKEAARIAKDTGKPLLLDFTASWCKPCQEMEKTFWTRPDVIALAQDFIAVKVNFDREKSLARKFYVSAIPNVVTTDPWENGLNFSKGFGGDGEKILARLIAVPKDFSSIKEAALRIDEDKKDIEALTKIAEFYKENKFYYLSGEFGKRILKLETDPKKSETLMLNTGFDYIRAGAPDEAEDLLKDFRKDFPNSPDNEAAVFGLGFVSLQKEKIKQAQKYLEELRSAYPKSNFIPQLEKEIEKAKSAKK